MGAITSSLPPAMTTVVLDTNLMTCPIAVAGASTWSAGNSAYGPYPTIVNDETIPYARWTRVDKTAVAARVGFDRMALPLGPINAILEVRGTVGTSQQINVRKGTASTNLAQVVVTLTDEWQKVVVPYTVWDDAGNYCITIVSTSGAVGDYVDARNAGFIVNGTEYFDGASAPANGSLFAWTGEDNDSTSVKTFDTFTWPPVVQPSLVLGYTADQDSRNILHDILGRPDMDVSLADASLRKGTLNLFFETAADAEAARVFHSQTALFHYTDTDVPTAAMTYVLDGSLSIALDDDTRTRWTLAVPFQEVKA